MVEPNKLKIRAEFSGLTEDFEGSPDEVIRALILSLNKVYPNLELAQKLSFQPDLLKLAENLVGLVEYAPEGLIFQAGEASADEAIIISLVGSYMGFKLGKISEDTNTADGLAKTCGKALKTVSNQLAWIIDDGLVERVERGKYRITSLGIKRFEQIVKKLRQEG